MNLMRPHLSLVKAGYQLDEVEIEVGVPPKLIPRFSICQPQSDSVEQITEELKQNRLKKYSERLKCC